MNYGAIIAQAWDVTRRSRTLKRLAAISAAQLIVYSVVLVALLVPLTVLPQLTMSLSGNEQGACRALTCWGPRVARRRSCATCPR